MYQIKHLWEQRFIKEIIIIKRRQHTLFYLRWEKRSQLLPADASLKRQLLYHNLLLLDPLGVCVLQRNKSLPENMKQIKKWCVLIYNFLWYFWLWFTYLQNLLIMYLFKNKHSNIICIHTHTQTYIKCVFKRYRYFSLS